VRRVANCYILFTLPYLTLSASVFPELVWWSDATCLESAVQCHCSLKNTCRWLIASRPHYWHCRHSMQSRVCAVVVHACIHLSVPSSCHTSPLQHVCCCELVRQAILIDWCSASCQQQPCHRSKCGQCHVSADVGCWTQTCSLLCVSVRACLSVSISPELVCVCLSVCLSVSVYARISLECLQSALECHWSVMKFIKGRRFVKMLQPKDGLVAYTVVMH